MAIQSMMSRNVSLTNQPTLKPTRKVLGGAAIGVPAGILLIWILEAFVLPTFGYNEPIPGDVAAATGSLLSFAASYLMKENEANS